VGLDLKTNNIRDFALLTVSHTGSSLSSPAIHSPDLKFPLHPGMQDTPLLLSPYHLKQESSRLLLCLLTFEIRGAGRGQGVGEPVLLKLEEFT